ncbi:HD-GYP domain-containing protein [Methylophilus sp. QUAN]|uniref:HD-GYP domain-containing protein n=1 Tax=Methylophilus sp. QUAN TaxID=2781020 RepID=UPI00188E08F9|nr:HD-GYP domain-containing protein [Methylophilus sp. QUAN]MBF4990950.1 HD-GYP domain-containing protein [Methylophilus sp. QUAN]
METEMNLPSTHFTEIIESSKSNLIEQLIKLAKDFSLLKEERDSNELELIRVHHRAMLKLALVASHKDDDTGTHIVRVGYLAEYFCKLLNKSDELCLMIRLAAPMHDLGKVGIPDSILKKNGTLTPSEREVMNTHTLIGEKILKDDIPVFNLASIISSSHHEKHDGTGYPRGLRGELIPFVGKIVAIVDFFDALCMDRCYRKAFTYEKTFNEIKDRAGTHFDPKLTDLFLENYQNFKLLRERIDKKKVTYENILQFSALSFFDEN